MRRLPWLGLIVPLALINALPLLAQFVRFDPTFEWRKGPWSFEKPAYPPDGTEAFAALLFALLANGCVLLSAWMRRHERWRRALPAASLAFALLFLGTLELGVRGWVRGHLLTPFRPSPDLFWTMQPSLRDYPIRTGNYAVSTDSHGFRSDHEVSPAKPPDVFRVVTIGDSGPFGHGVADTETYQTHLQRLLGERCRGRTIEVVNACVPGWTTFEGRRFISRSLEPFHPDLMVLGFNDDTGFDWLEDKQRFEEEGAAERFGALLYRSEVYLLLRKVLLETKQLGGEPRNPPQPDLSRALVRRVSKEDFVDNLQAIIDWTRTHDCKLVLVNNPVNLAVYRNFQGGGAQQDIMRKAIDFSYRDLLKEVAAKNRVAYLDTHDEWARRPDAEMLFLPHDIYHPNAIGQRLFATQLATLIGAQGLIPGLTASSAPDAAAGAPTQPRSPPKTSDFRASSGGIYTDKLFFGLIMLEDTDLRLDQAQAEDVIRRIHHNQRKMKLNQYLDEQLRRALSSDQIAYLKGQGHALSQQRLHAGVNPERIQDVTQVIVRLAGSPRQPPLRIPEGHPIQRPYKVSLITLFIISFNDLQTVHSLGISLRQARLLSPVLQRYALLKSLGAETKVGILAELTPEQKRFIDEKAPEMPAEVGDISALQNRLKSMLEKRLHPPP